MGEARYHVRFVDEAAGEALGLLLVETPQVGLTRRLINPYAAKGSSGATKDSDLTEWSVVSQRDWRGGRGQEDMEEASAFLDGWNLETRIKEQLTLGPLPQQQVAATLPRYEPGSASPFGVGEPVHLYRSVGADDEYLGTTPSVAMRFRVPAHYQYMDLRAGVIWAIVKKMAGTTTVIRAAIYDSDARGLPNSELVHTDVQAADVGTTYDWVTFTLASPESVTAGADYWIVLTSPGKEDGYAWMRESDRSILRDGANWNPGMGNWYRAGGDFSYILWWAKISRSMSFTAPSGGLTCDLVQLYLCNRALHPADAFFVTLCEDSAGSPGTVLKTKTIHGSDVSHNWGWVEVEWDAGQVLASETVYHIVVAPTAMGSAGYLLWGGSPAGGYGSGASALRVDSGSWTGKAEDLYFRVKRDDLQGDVVGFARYDGHWYCASGDSVYKWNSGTSAWDSSDQKSGDEVTALESWGGYLWAARGTEWVLRKFDGSTWSDVSGKYAQHLKAGGGYLHYSDASAGNTHKVYYTANGTDWSSAIECGNSGYGITGMAWYRDMLVVATSIQLWGIAAELAYPVLDWSSQEDADNGREMLVWGRTGCLYIPLRFGLYRWNGDTMVAVGPEQGTGLPAARAGKVVKMVGTGNWLFAAVDAGSGGTSSILAYNGMGGWHEMMRAEVAGQRVRTMGFETISSPSRLWYGLSKETRYLMLPDYSDNPWQYVGYEYNVGGELITSWMGGELLEVVKDLYEVVVRAENVSSARPVLVYYEIDRSGSWTLLGEVTESPRQSLGFTASGFSSKTVGSGSTETTIELGAGESTDDINAGDWCRINAEVSQVASITDGDTFVLETALSESPEAGDTVYASRPAGREFRLKLVLSTDGKTETPKVKAVFLRYQNNVLDRFVYTLQVRVEDGMSDLAGNPYPHTAADLRVVLDEWAKRVLPFSLLDQDGVAHTVKVTSVGEGGMTRKAAEGQAARYGSVYSMNLVEVG